MAAAALIVCHMDAPYGQVPGEQDVCDSLRNGKPTIVRCAVEFKVPIAQANRLYQETLADGFVRCPAWEQAAAALT